MKSNGGARFRSADWFELVSGVSIDLQVPRRYERGKPGCRFQSMADGGGMLAVSYKRT